MSIQNYNVIDSVALRCVNIIIWDGEEDHALGPNLIKQVSDNTIQIGDTVQLTNGVYVFVNSQEPPSAVDSFNIDQFSEDLLGAFAGDSNILPYYSVVKDLATFKNFSGMKAIMAQLFAATKITQDEVNTLNSVLMNQKIDLSTF